MMKTILAFTFLAASIFQSATAYCIYNHMADTAMNADQEPYFDSISLVPRIFKKYIGPGASECCPYTEGDCAVDKNRNSTIEINITTTNGYRFPQIKIQAGGFIIVTDAVAGSPIPVCSRYNWDNAFTTNWRGYDKNDLSVH